MLNTYFDDLHAKLELKGVSTLLCDSYEGRVFSQDKDLLIRAWVLHPKFAAFFRGAVSNDVVSDKLGDFLIKVVRANDEDLGDRLLNLNISQKMSSKKCSLIESYYENKSLQGDLTPLERKVFFAM